MGNNLILVNEIDDAVSYFRMARNELRLCGEISLNAGMKDLHTAIRNMHSKLLKVVDGSITKLSAENLLDLETIRPYAFYGNTNLESIEIPSTVKSIGENAFYGCTNLKKASYFGSEEEWNSINVGTGNDKLISIIECYSNIFYALIEDENGAFYEATTFLGDDETVTHIRIAPTYDGIPVKVIGMMTFANLTTLVSVSIPNNITTIEGAAFVTCVNLKNIEFPESLEVIENNAFVSCGLESVTFGKNTNFIGRNAFANCLNCLIYDFTTATVVPTLEEDNAFLNINASCKIKVPSALYNEWVTATNWATYADHIVAV